MKKNSESIKALIRNLSKEKNIDTQILLRSYLLERLLERISLSKYKNNFILKGGLLICSMVGVDLRSTIDLDTTVKKISLTKESIKEIFESILSIQVDDCIEIDITKIQKIRQEDEYSGFRLSMVGKMDNARIPIKVDISTGDIITPSEIVYKYKLLLEDREINIPAYTLETILAEKIETILSRGLANTRIRDFYDIYILIKTKKNSINTKLLVEAITSTAKKRDSLSIIQNDLDLVLEEVFEDISLQKLWENYQKKYPYANGITWEDLKNSILELIKMFKTN